MQSVPAGDSLPREHWNKQICVLLVAHNGDGGEAAANAIRAALPKPLIDWAGPIPYAALSGRAAVVLEGDALKGKFDIRSAT